MSNIDIEIEKLEKQLAALKKAKCEEDLCNKKGNFYISIFDDDENDEPNDTKNRFSTFNELKQFWESPKCKLKQTDFISLTYFSNGQYQEYEAHVDSNGKIIQKEFEDIVKVISTLDLWQLIICEFAICNKKDVLRNIAFIRSDKIIELGNLMDQGMSTLKATMSEEEYWKNVDEGKKYRLFGDN
jgi:rubredoxin